MRCDATHVLPRTLHKCQILPLRAATRPFGAAPPQAPSARPLTRGGCAETDTRRRRVQTPREERKRKKKKKWIRRVACVSTCLAFLSKTTNKERRKEGIGPLIVEASRLLRLRVVLTLTHTRIHKTRFLHSSRQYSVYFSYKSSGSTRERKRLRNAPLSIVPLSVRPLRSVDEDMAFETHEYLPTYFGPRQRRAVLPPPKCLSIQIAIPCVASVRERPRRLRCSCTGT